ncbi:MAG: (2Fe-2S)-binding protein [Betaproteobacteria bacterium]|jgi:2-furoyl-CoA dehydrogenase 2Fe-2S iron sulfur subunit
MKTYGKDAQHEVALVLNGIPRSGPAETRTLLSDFLRHTLGATGTHVGCEHGVCGACTVRIDGEPARACLTLALQTHGCQVQTVEGLAEPGVLGPLQQAFRRHHALQCGFCTAGILNSASAWLERVARGEAAPTEAAVRDLLSGHLCRCTGYTPIVKAILEVARDAAAGGAPATD